MYEFNIPTDACGVERDICIRQTVNNVLRTVRRWINKNVKIGRDRNKVSRAFYLWMNGELNKDNNPLETNDQKASFIYLKRLAKNTATNA